MMEMDNSIIYSQQHRLRMNKEGDIWDNLKTFEVGFGHQSPDSFLSKVIEDILTPPASKAITFAVVGEPGSGKYRILESLISKLRHDEQVSDFLNYYGWKFNRSKIIFTESVHQLRGERKIDPTKPFVEFNANDYYQATIRTGEKWLKELYLGFNGLRLITVELPAVTKIGNNGIDRGWSLAGVLAKYKYAYIIAVEGDPAQKEATLAERQGKVPMNCAPVEVMLRVRDEVDRLTFQESHRGNLTIPSAGIPLNNLAEYKQYLRENPRYRSRVIGEGLLLHLMAEDWYVPEERAYIALNRRRLPSSRKTRDIRSGINREEKLNIERADLHQPEILQQP